jgi:hypothetical protein
VWTIHLHTMWRSPSSRDVGQLRVYISDSTDIRIYGYTEILTSPSSALSRIITRYPAGLARIYHSAERVYPLLKVSLRCAQEPSEDDHKANNWQLAVVTQMSDRQPFPVNLID